MHSRISITRRWFPDGLTESLLEDLSVSLGQLPRLPIVFLTGDPGSGKTDTVKEFVREAPNRRRRELFSDVTSTAQVRNWLTECFESNSELFLDAYDERSGQFRRDFLLEPLIAANASGSCPPIRVVSRAAHLPEDLVDDARKIVGLDDAIPVLYRLLPLTEPEIRHWVKNRLPDTTHEFFQEVNSKQLGCYLARPVDLEAFISSFKMLGTLGGNPSEAWMEAIKQELSESNPDRLDRQTELGAKTDVNDRLRVAQILAVAQHLCDSGPILIDGGSKRRGVAKGLSPSELYTQTHFVFPDMEKPVFQIALRETIQSGLFEQAKDGAFFSSAAKAQFLAARFLSGVAPDQIINILKDRLIGTRVPETAQPLAAEVAKFVPSLFEWLCENQPMLCCVACCSISLMTNDPN